jgi:transcriptional regulator with XRE-family HTH domain
MAAEPANGEAAGERRRRTSGLRREEVAEMASISSTWYTRLEQGKAVTPSGAALCRIADVLGLAPAGRAYVFELARRVDPKNAPIFVNELTSSAIQSCVLSIGHPAYVLDKYWTPLFWNEKLAELFSQWLSGPDRNLLRYMFLDASVRTLVVDWELRARRLVAQFRIDFAKHIDDPKMLELVDKLSEQSDIFLRFWKEQRVMFWDEVEKSYNHPRLGLLQFHQSTFLAAPDATLKLVVLKPCQVD